MTFMSSWFDSPAYEIEQPAANFQSCPCLDLRKDVYVKTKSSYLPECLTHIPRWGSRGLIWQRKGRGIVSGKNAKAKESWGVNVSE